MDVKTLYKNIINFGYYDAFRSINPNIPGYTYWDYGQSFKNDIGVRIDHFLLSPYALDKVEKIDHAIAWDIKGRSISSNEFANLITEYSMNDHQIEFVIGGSHGLSNEVLDKSNHVISASKLTFPHRLFKIILSEQIYRACSIISNHPYHK